jgi:hypothetical protein
MPSAQNKEEFGTIVVQTCANVPVASGLGPGPWPHRCLDALRRWVAFPSSAGHLLRYLQTQIVNS